eukprot:349961-Chlamydomonas_euryale.AAC.14
MAVKSNRHRTEDRLGLSIQLSYFRAVLSEIMLDGWRGSGTTIRLEMPVSGCSDQPSKSTRCDEYDIHTRDGLDRLCSSGAPKQGASESHPIRSSAPAAQPTRQHGRLGVRPEH